ncbi:helix-turn-helix domain-containing protein [Pseudomonas sp. Snoq117.2]|uniref:AlbA family DNA-binding domain-containing protein n=1 Tax=Pseudomonas sp. Snoq117.2 TaxID=1500302 RepID=UPI0008AB9300|nr:hypothetical protein [Pseudomonas sp. Snoq117.2]SEP36600.1 hypothetical protein SAMN02787149_10785 [Pseudomonas sp. Snoq117.2]
MTLAELKQILARGEDSRHQFKRDFNHVDALAAELVAFANMAGGYLCRGLGTGIPRAIDAWPEIELHDDRQSNQFRVVIKRPVERGTLSGLSGDEAGTKSGPGRAPVGTESLADCSAADARPPVQPEQVTLLQRMFGDHATPELTGFVGRSNRSKFHEQVLAPLLARGWSK